MARGPKPYVLLWFGGPRAPNPMFCYGLGPRGDAWSRAGGVLWARAPKSFLTSIEFGR